MKLYDRTTDQVSLDEIERIPNSEEAFPLGSRQREGGRVVVNGRREADGAILFETIESDNAEEQREPRSIDALIVVPEALAEHIEICLQPHDALRQPFA